MKLFLAGCFVVLLWSQVLAGEMEVRCYQVGKVTLQKAMWSLPGEDWVSEDGAEKKVLGPVVVEAGLESRFLGKTDELRDCTDFVRTMLGEGFKGRAVYVEKTRRLVMSAALEDHEVFAEMVASEMPRQMRIRVSVYEIPRLGEGKGSVFWRKPPVDAKKLAGVSCLAIPGQPFQGRTAGGELEVEMEFQADQEGDIGDLRIDSHLQMKKRRFSLSTSWLALVGVMQVEELGSLDGKSTLVLAIECEPVTTSGKLADEWVLKEGGGAFLGRERLERMRRKSPVETAELKKATEVRTFIVPPTILRFLSYESPEQDDPFASTEKGGKEEGPLIYEGNAPELRGRKGMVLYDIRKLLMENGLELRDGDFAVYSEGESLVLAKLESSQMELLDGIIGHGDHELPRMIRVSLVQWEGGVSGEVMGDQRLRKMGSVMLPGQTCKVTLGRDLAMELEGQIDANVSLIELRATLSETRRNQAKASFKTGLTLENGVPVVVHESWVGGKRRAWVVTARVIQLDRELDEFLSR